MRTKALFLFACAMLAAGVLSAQDLQQEENPEYKDSVMAKIAYMRWRSKLLVADQLMEQGSYVNAIAVYEMVNKDKPENIYTLNKLGEANYFIRHYPNAVKWFSLLFEKDTVKYPYARYYLAKSLKYNAQYNEAIPEFDRFHKTDFKFKNITDEDRMKDVKSTVADEIEGCKLALNYALEKPRNIIVENIGAQANHPLTDLSPKLLSDSLLLYAALLPDSAFATEDTSDIRYTRMLVAEKTAEGWANSKLYDFPYNTGNFHVGNGSFSPDKQRFYFTRCGETEKLGIICQIYESSLNNGTWSEPVLLDEAVNGDFSSTHPMAALNAKGEEVLFYASTRSGGRGGFDIWQVTRDPQTRGFKDISNFGVIINTYYNDMTPYYDSKTRTLYYSSDGRINIGGFDIYSSKQDTLGNWQEPVDLGIPINSSVDDLYFAFGENKSKGFLVSNRPGGLSPKSPTCCDDIWAFKFPATFVFVEGWVTDDSTGERIREGTVNIYDAETDSLVSSAPITEDGYYKARLMGDKKYKLKATSEKYYDAEVSLSTENREEGELLRKDIAMKKRPYWVGMKFPIVYYDFDKSKLRDDARPILKNLIAILKHYPVIIEIGGHTDEMGDTAYNQILSDRRAEAVYNYLLREGISKEQLVQKGYGERVPVAPNHNADGSDNPEGRQLNRRAVFTVVGEMKPLRQ